VTAPAPADLLPTARWRAIGTDVAITVTRPEALAPARDVLAAELDAVDRACSRFRPDAEITGLTAGGTRPLSPLLTDLVAAALRAAGSTDGDVDPTLGGALVELGYDRDLAALPADGPRVRIVPRPAPGWQRVHLDTAARTITLPPGVVLDLGATAKAWLVDRAAVAAATATGAGVLVTCGGDLATAGPVPDGGWSVLVQDGERDGDQPATTVTLDHGGAMATSSTVRRTWNRDGRLLHHILDPRTCLPPAPVWRTVTVAATTCLAANAVSTAAIVRGAAALGWVRSLGLPARFVAVTGDVTTVGPWPADRGPR
jgi:thiamine biosynthesis lipoprotein